MYHTRSSTASVREKKQLQSPTVHHVYSYNSYTVYYTILLHHSKAAPLAAERCHGSAAAIHREMGHHRKNSTLAELVFHCLKQIRKPSKVRHTYTRRKADGLSSSNHAKISRGGSFSFFFIVSLIQRVGNENISVIKQQGISNSQHTYKSKSSNQYHPSMKTFKY